MVESLGYMNVRQVAGGRWQQLGEEGARKKGARGT